MIAGCQQASKKNPDPLNILSNHEKNPGLVIRFAKLEIDSSQLSIYLDILREGIQRAIATEPGVLTMYGVQEQSTPSNVTILEIYLNDSAYQAHLQTEHFLKYKASTREMVKSLELVELDPVLFAVRQKGLKNHTLGTMPYQSEVIRFQSGY